MIQHSLTAPHKDFESIKKIDENGVEFWEARELMPLLEYSSWRNFEQTVIEKAQQSCIKSGQSIHYHFAGVDKMIKVAKDTVKETTRLVGDYKLSRYACYLIAQNGDPRKEAVALAQTYFAVQARRQEVFDSLSEEEQRLFIRGKVKEHNKDLFGTAKKAGVKNFGKFNNMGYLGLYGMSAQNVKKYKHIENDDILDRAGTTELAANLFRITQTDEKLKRDQTKGEGQVSGVHFFVGNKVRKSIEDIGGTMPEDLPVETHIQELKKNSQPQLSLKKKK